jgi:hypothetical protein
MLIEGKEPLTGTPEDGLVNPASGDLRLIEETVTELDKALKELQEAVERLRENLDQDPQ